MKTSRLLGSILSVLLTTAAWPGIAGDAASVNEERAVWQAMVDAIARDNAEKPFKQLYFKTDFSTAPIISTAMSDPDINEFCGVPRPEAQSLIGQLMVVNSEAVQLDASIAGHSGMRLGRKLERTMRYVAMSRVVFDAGNQRAWLAVDLSGGRGGIVRLDKVGGAWNWSSRCAAWVKPRV